MAAADVLRPDVMPLENVKLQAAPPRFLTPEEINDILNEIPQVAAALPIIALIVRSEIQESLRPQIAELQICPDAIPKLKGWIKNQFYRSKIHPGEPIGITTAEAVGAPMTQMTLNTFHHTGSAKAMSMGIDAFRELFNATQRRRNENTTLHFKRKDMSFDEVLEMRSTLVGVSIGDLAKAYRLEFTMREDGSPVPLENRGWWYGMYASIMAKEFTDSRCYLRLEFNTTLLYTYKVTLNDIVIALEQNEPRVLRCVASPSSVGIIDVYPDERVIRKSLTDFLGRTLIGINDANASILFMKLKVAPQLASFVLKGIKGLTQIFPVEVTTWSVIQSEEPYYSEERLEAHITQRRAAGDDEKSIQDQAKQVRQTWKLNMDLIRMRTSGINMAKLRALLAATGITVLHPPPPEGGNEAPPRQVLITMPEDWEDTLPLSENDRKVKPRPGLYVDMLLKADEKKVEDELNVKRQPYVDAREAARDAKQPLPDIPFIPRIPTPLMRAGNYVYAEANGINLRAVLAHPLVDRRYTISNNPHEILAVLGIEACRNFMAREFYEMIVNNGAYVNPRYIDLIADFMTSIGILVSITSRGIARQRRGAFADASFEHPVEVFVEAAVEGRVEEVKSTSTAIFTGTRALIGTGSFQLGLIDEAMKAIEARNVAAEPRAPAEVKQDVAAVVGDLAFGTETFRFDESAAGSVEDVLFATPDPAGTAPGMGAEVQAPKRAMGNEANLALPIPGVQPIVVIQPKLLAPKGPVPQPLVTRLALSPWVANLLRDIAPAPVAAFDFNQLMASALSQQPVGEQDVGLLNVNDFLAE